jgi:hypothetical protein
MKCRVWIKVNTRPEPGIGLQLRQSLEKAGYDVQSVRPIRQSPGFLLLWVILSDPKRLNSLVQGVESLPGVAVAAAGEPHLLSPEPSVGFPQGHAYEP